jgi:UDP-N-acetylmuramoyl-tripeptide--D-alanyl-D-alanine ligase
LIDGCYNANPMSMRAALEDLADTVARAPGARPVAVLGDMLELGPEAPDYHRELGQRVAQAGVELLVTVGPLGSAIAERFEGELRAVDDAETAAELVRATHAICPYSRAMRGNVRLATSVNGIALEVDVEAALPA